VAKPPRSIKVGTATYSVECDDVARRELAGNSCRGDTDREYLRIRVSPDQHADVIRSTLVHEFLHAIVGETSLKQSVLKEHDDEEIVVSEVARALLDALDRNPALRRYLWPR
jgi:hypothetical protein